MKQRIIGITGGIATGKTTVSDYLHQTYGLPVLDADIYAREALQGEILHQIIQRYGTEVLDDPQAIASKQNPSLNRQKLGAIIFQDVEERKWLEGLIHPYVRDRFHTAAKQYQSNTLVMVIPLLFEAKLQNLVTEVWVVACDLNLELERLMQRNGLSAKEAKLRIQSQMPLSEKILLADVVLENNGTSAELFDQVDNALFNSPLGFSTAFF
ncbi:dephospho-CoA kinase [Tumidithrix elongata RA019]|uniref:Dephospho-CoA kinase n=1 Tax=Tumidithrix elongata BACA0141 TaxID=2716417 RepID=A0AAW9PYS3_9CYAN|nr:dephospho-CoA kinase [Tumidithrix elongata RA019]